MKWGAYRGRWRRCLILLPFMLVTLVLFVLSNFYPVAEGDLRLVGDQAGRWGVINLIGTCQIIAGVLLVSALAMRFQIAETLTMLYLLIAKVFSLKHRSTARFALRIKDSRFWTALNMLLIGLLVVLVKVTMLPQVSPGIAFGAYIVLMIILTAAVSFDPQELWEYLQDEPPC